MFGSLARTKKGISIHIATLSQWLSDHPQYHVGMLIWEIYAKLSFSRLWQFEMSLKKKETPGSTLFGLSDNVYLFLCRFDVIWLHSFRGGGLILALILCGFRWPAFSGGHVRRVGFMRTEDKWMPHRPFEISYFSFQGTLCTLFTSILLSKFYYILYRSFTSKSESLRLRFGISPVTDKAPSWLYEKRQTF
jgi:hypothetical protein